MPALRRSATSTDPFSDSASPPVYGDRRVTSPHVAQPPTTPHIPIVADHYEHSSPFHAMPIEDVCRSCCVPSLAKGLRHAHAAEHRRVLGGNHIPIDDGPSVLRIILGQFFNSITVILGLVAIVSGIFKDWAELGVVIFVIFFNGALGGYQEISAEKSLASLKQMTVGVTKVMRDGMPKVVSIDEIVVGDVVILEQGASVPADLRLFEVASLEIDEGMLTGESLPVAKHTNIIPDPDLKCALGDRKNMAYRQTTVTNGRGKGIVVCAGLKTQMGKLAATLSKHEGSSETPLQRKMRWMMWALFAVSLLLAVIVFGVNDWSFDNSTIIYACAVGVGIIPESLVAVITVATSISVFRMAKHKCIVRKLAALEVLGNVTDICSDKTGTLTENKMVTAVIVPGIEEPIEVSGGTMSSLGTFTKFDAPSPPAASTGRSESEAARDDDAVDVTPIPETLMEAFLRCCALCTTTTIKPREGMRHVLFGTGNPTEVAIQVMTWKAHANRERFHERGFVRVGEFPFDSTVKRMTVVNSHAPTSSLLTCTKGAPERVLELCTSWMRPDGEIVDLGEADVELIHARVKQLAGLGLRTICFAQRIASMTHTTTDVSSVDRKHFEAGLTFVGLVGIYDPPRAESRASVLLCQQAGIKVRMLTGDHTDTARAIATKLEIIHDPDGETRDVIAGPDFDKLTEADEDVLGDLPAVVGRCSPESKVKMIKALHRRGRIVAMTGDGFNDSPSIKIADIGCAMGSGTDVTKGVADIVITDDNFATIVAAIAEGRRISSSIRKFVIHLLSGNVAQVIALVIGLSIMQEGRSVYVLSPLGVLFVNIVGGSPPATGLTLDEADPEILRQPPNTAGFFTKELIIDTLVYGVSLGVSVLCSFIFVVYGGNDGLRGKDCNSSSGTDCDVIWRARATAFSVLYVGILAHAYNVRNTRKSIFRMRIFDNRWLWGSCLFSVVSLFPIIYIEAVATHVFVHAAISWEWAVVVIALICFMALCELYKIVKNVAAPLASNSIDEEVDSGFLYEVAPIARRSRSTLEMAQDSMLLSITTIEERIDVDDSPGAFS